MTIINSSEEQLLLTQPQNTKLWLSVYQPTIIFQARVNDIVIGKGEREITYDGLSFGSHLLVESNFIMYVGLSEGSDDKGKVRVRSITDSVVTVAENDHINWSDDDYLTIVRYIINEAVFPRIIRDPNDDEDVIFYKDYDIAYTDQNSVLGTVVNMGSHYAGFLEDGNHNVFYSSSGTISLRGEDVAYEWFFQGASVTGSNASEPGLVSYDTPGHYMTRLITSGTSVGAIDTSYRWVSIYDRPGQGTNIPIMNWEFDGFSGRRDSGGYTGSIKIRESVPETLIKPDSLVVIFSEDWYGSTKQSIGGNQPNRENIVFTGYVLDGTIQYDFATSYVEFDIASITELTKAKEGFSISVEDSKNPTKWFELLDMTPKRAIYHFLRWQSTLAYTTDFRFLGDEWDRPVQYFDADRSSLYDATYALASTGLLGSQVADRQGTVWFEIDPCWAEASVTGNALSLSNRLWVGSPNVTEKNIKDVSYIELNGIAYPGNLQDSDALLSGAPGEAPDYSGSDGRISGLILTSQTQLNILSGNYYAAQNAQYPASVFQLGGSYRNYDIAPIELVSVDDPIVQTSREITFDGLQFYIISMTWGYNPSAETLIPQLVLKEVTTGFPGTTIIIPVTPPDDGWSNVSPFDFPPLPPFPPLPGLNGIELYDEGDFQGVVTKLDFIGASVSAVKNGEIGEVTISVSSVNDSNLVNVRTGSAIWSTGESMAKKIVDFGTNVISFGVDYDASNKKFDILVDGTYQVNVSGGIQYNSNQMSADTSYMCKFYIERYNSSDVLLETYAALGSPAFLVDIDDQLSSNNSSTANTNVTANLQMDIGDYVKIFAEGFPKVGNISSADVFTSVSRL